MFVGCITQLDRSRIEQRLRQGSNVRFGGRAAVSPMVCLADLTHYGSNRIMPRQPPDRPSDSWRGKAA